MSYKKSALVDALPHQSVHEYPPFPCRTCNEPAPRPMLSAHGGLCYRCYSSYCRSGPEPRPYQAESPAVQDVKKHMRAGHKFNLTEHL